MSKINSSLFCWGNLNLCSSKKRKNYWIDSDWCSVRRQVIVGQIANSSKRTRSATHSTVSNLLEYRFRSSEDMNGNGRFSAIFPCRNLIYWQKTENLLLLPLCRPSARSATAATWKNTCCTKYEWVATHSRHDHWMRSAQRTEEQEHEKDQHTQTHVHRWGTRSRRERWNERNNLLLRTIKYNGRDTFVGLSVCLFFCLSECLCGRRSWFLFNLSDCVECVSVCVL